MDVSEGLLVNLLENISDLVDEKDLIDVDLGPFGNDALNNFDSLFFLHSCFDFILNFNYILLRCLHF